MVCCSHVRVLRRNTWTRTPIRKDIAITLEMERYHGVNGLLLSDHRLDFTKDLGTMEFSRDLLLCASALKCPGE